MFVVTSFCLVVLVYLFRGFGKSKAASLPDQRMLDADYSAARWKRDKPSFKRIRKAAKNGNTLAKAYAGSLFQIQFEEWEVLNWSDLDNESKYALESMLWLLTQAGKGNMYAEYNFAACFMDAREVKYNRNLALKYFTRAANQGHAESLCALAKYHDGERSNKAGSTKKMVQFYTLATELGHVGAQYKLGEHYLALDGSHHGKSTPLDQADSPPTKSYHEQAFAYFSLAAAQGLPRALRKVGECYQHGQGVLKNAATAKEWYTRAAKSGDLTAKQILTHW